MKATNVIPFQQGMTAVRIAKAKTPKQDEQDSFGDDVARLCSKIRKLGKHRSACIGVLEYLVDRQLSGPRWD